VAARCQVAAGGGGETTNELTHGCESSSREAVRMHVNGQRGWHMAVEAKQLENQLD